MALELQPPTPFEKISESDRKVRIFLGGSIEMGNAVDWQADVRSAFADCDDVVLLNPRREAWDSSWVQDKDNPVFREQVEWELFALENCHVAFMYFDPSTRSPISLMELGLFAHHFGPRHKLMHVVCPDSFWRKGNVDIVCERYGIPQFPDLATLTAHVKNNLDLFRIWF